MEPMSKSFIKAVEEFAIKNNAPVILFKKGERKDDVAKQYLRAFQSQEGLLFVGKAQEKTSVFRTERRKNQQTGQPYPWIVRSTAMVNQLYFYIMDEDFGPIFIKFSTYFPYTAKLYLNGHEYAKRQLEKEGIIYEPLDNGILSCADPKRLQQLCDELSEDKIRALLNKWMNRLPNPFTKEDRQAGYDYDISILQAEFALTQVLDKPVSGRMFFEEIIRENLDLGRPEHVQLLFNRRVTKRTPGRFRTRVITQGTIPSFHLDYKHSRIKQYHKEGRALRTETTINNTRDFDIGKRLENLPLLRKVGFSTNRRLLEAQRVTTDCFVGEDTYQKVQNPVVVEKQRAAGMRFSDARVLALFCMLTAFCLLPRGFTNRDLREQMAPLLGLRPMTRGKVTYDLRRLRLHGLIVRIPKSHRYQLTDLGLRVVFFVTRVHARLFRKGLGQLLPEKPPDHTPLRTAFDRFEQAIEQWCDKAQFTASAA
jgi:hypothetical protein